MKLMIALKEKGKRKVRNEEGRICPEPGSNMDTNSKSPCKTKISKTTPQDSEIDNAEPQKEFSKKNTT